MVGKYSCCRNDSWVNVIPLTYRLEWCHLGLFVFLGFPFQLRLTGSNKQFVVLAPPMLLTYPSTHWLTGLTGSQPKPNSRPLCRDFISGRCCSAAACHLGSRMAEPIVGKMSRFLDEHGTLKPPQIRRGQPVEPSL